MPRSAVLDADVLVPIALCDTLLHQAEAGLFDPGWSGRILNETRTALVEDLAVSPDKAERRIRHMQAAFRSASADEDTVARLEPTMTNDAKDRHVLAAAVARGAGLIVTRNVRDFPASACEVHGIEAIHPDDFLLGQFRPAPDGVRAALAQQVADLTNPPMSLADLLGVLRTWVPRFVRAFALDAGITSG